jgi:hypothetical protein
MTTILGQPATFVKYIIAPLTPEQNTNYVLCSFLLGEVFMIRAVVEEAAALASVSLFLGMLAVWAQVFAVL